jgi:hypothetical protein
MKRIVIALLVVVAMAGGAAVYLILRSPGTGAPDGAAAQQASQAFFADRGGGTPGPNIMTFGDGGGGQVPGVVGEVTAIDGERLTVKNPMDGTTRVVHVPAGTKIERPVAGKLVDLTIGTPILAIGTRNGDVVDAQQIQITGKDTAGGPVMIGKGASGDGEPPPGTPGAQIFNGAVPGLDNGTPQPAGTPGDQVFLGGAKPDGGTITPATIGTITAVTGNKLTVQGSDGTTTTVQVGDSTDIRKPATVSLGEVRVGDTVAAQGTPHSDVFEATGLQVLRAAP